MRTASVLSAALSIPSAAALKLTEQLLILHIARFHGYRLPRIFHSLRIVVQACLGKRAQIVPACIAFARRHRIERIKRFSIMAGIDIILRCAHLDNSILLLLILLTLPAVSVRAAKECRKRIILRPVSALPITAITTVSAITIRALLLTAAIIAAACARTAALPAMHDLLIRLLNFHELFFRLCGVRFTYVCIRMIFFTELAIRFFYLVVCRRRGYPQHLIRIHHSSFFAFLLSLAISNRCQIPE